MVGFRFGSGDGEPGRLKMKQVRSGSVEGPLSSTAQSKPLTRNVRTLSTARDSPNSVMSSKVHGEEDRSVASQIRRQQASGTDGLLRVQVESCVQKTTFYVPVSLMLQREMEMREAATSTNVNRSRWSASKLYTLWKRSMHKEGEEEITLRLTPETSMQDYSELMWKPWLTTCIRAYYNTGTIRIPEDCLGSDILLALEYFGILTSSPDTFAFESSHALDRIKMWSSYFTHRSAIADWVVADTRGRRGGTRVWVTSANPEEANHGDTLLQVKGATASVLDGGLREIATAFGNHASSCQLIHRVFFDCESDNLLTKETPYRMRQDFTAHLRRSLEAFQPTITFDVEQVKITRSSGKISTVFRAVLRITLETPVTGGSLRAPNLQAEADRKHSNSIRFASSGGKATNSPTGKQLEVADINDQQSVRRVLFETESEEAELARLPSGIRLSCTPCADSDSNQVEGKPRGQRGGASTPGIALQSRERASGVDSQLDERHPTHGTPPPDGRRSSPENVQSKPTYCMAPEKVSQKMRVIDTQDMRTGEAGAPVGYINTAFGDLQSVTSALSDPYMDDSTVGSLSSRFLVQSARRLALQKEGFKTSPSPSVSTGNNVDTTADPRKTPEPLNKRQNVPLPEIPEVPPAIDRGWFPSEPTTTQHPTCGGYWEGLISNMCETVTPNAHPTSRSASPVQAVSMKMNVPLYQNDQQSITSFGEIPMKSGRSRGYMNQCPQSNVEELNAWEDFAKLTKTLSHESTVAAKNIGQTLSSQFDEFLKLALNSTGGIPEEQDDDGDHTGKPTSSKASESLPRGQKNGIERVRSEGVHRPGVGAPKQMGDGERRTSPSNLIAKKSRKSPEMLNSSRPSAFALATNGSSKLFDKEIHLPPREPRRARSQQKVSIARKKQSAQAKAAPDYRHHDVLKAKVDASARAWNDSSSS